MQTTMMGGCGTLSSSLRLALDLLLLVHAECYTAAQQLTIKIKEGVDKRSTDKDSASLLDGIEVSAFSGPAALSFLAGQCFEKSFDRYDYKICPFHNITRKRLSATKGELLGVWGSWTPPATAPAVEVASSSAQQEDGEQQQEEGEGEQQQQEGTGEEVSVATVATGSTTTTMSTTSAPTTPTCHRYMRYLNGKECGNDEKMLTIVKLKCAHSQSDGTAEFEVVSVDDSTHCTYSFELGLPIACFLLGCDDA
jgi:hypothetical protein